MKYVPSAKEILAEWPRFAIIGAIILALAISFAFTAGWLSQHRITPDKLLTALQSPNGPPLGHRRNHSKGICFTGSFTANGQGSTLSTANLFAAGKYPVVGRLNFAGSDPHMPDAMAQARGLSLRITTPDGQEWRTAMIDAPFFATPTPQAFYQFLSAADSKDPDAMKQYIAAHPEVLKFIDWAKNHPRSESWAEDRFNSLNSFLFIDSARTKRAVRWSFVPAAKFITVPPDELANRSPDFLEQEIAQRVKTAPVRWDMIVTIANPGDPTSDPTKAWPADRKTVDVGTLAIDRIEAEPDGPCRDINYDPTVLPSGIATSDDAFPAARSAAYRASFDHRITESSQYPHNVTEGK